MTSIMKVNMAHQSEIMNNILARLAHSTTVNSRDLMKVSKRRRKNSKTISPRMKNLRRRVRPMEA